MRMDDVPPELPPLGSWARAEARRVLDGLADDLSRIEADEAWRRLARLTPEQRDWVIDQIDGWGPDGPAPEEE
jgi:hypothetical protein